MSWQTGDLRAPFHPVVFEGGDEVVDQVTLDLCGDNFPSEQHRIARHQVGVNDDKTSAHVSIEAVLYDTPLSAAQAMRELRAAKSTCPNGYVRGDVAGVPPLRYRFAPAPDSTWKRVKGVDRLAVAFTVNDQQGHTEQSNAVYQQRGRLLVGLYAANANAITGVLTRSLKDFTDVLAHRMAALPATTVSGPARTA